jgi:hypothetical protein
MCAQVNELYSPWTPISKTAVPRYSHNTVSWSIEITFILLVWMKDAKNTYMEDYKAKEIWKYLEL